jgi:K319-like protein
MRAPWSGLAIAGVLALAACSKLSQVGHLSQGSPNAVAATPGQPFTTDSSGLHTTVRAGADVVLSGGDSYNTPDDAGVPIITWTWQQLNAGANAVDLVKRSNAVVSFTAPQVTAATTLTFQLTVTTATGATASTQAMVTVEPVRDADHFLTFLNTRDAAAVTAVTSAVVPANAQAAYNDTLPYTITVTELVTYTDNDGLQHTRVQAGTPTVYTGSWSAALGSGGASCTDPRNPKTQIAIPKLNLDSFLYDSSGHSTGQRLSDVMQSSDVDIDPANAHIPPAVVEAEIQIASVAALPGGATAAACIGDATIPIASTTLTADALTISSNASVALFDSSASAHTYYATIDPQGQRTTLSAWLKANGFDPTVSGWAADAHAVYTNNYDLGFGRDMYMKLGACDSGFSIAPVSQFSAQSLSPQTAQKLTQLIGHCDVASVVVNYVSVQAAAEHLNQIVAVAMEYSASPGIGARFTKFYVFAPDQRTGQLQRVTGVDLDHRGQKPVPQSCVVCHGGLPAAGGAGGGAQQYDAKAPSGIAGDVQAGFLPWDLDSFWYSDTDPGFSTKSEDAAIKAQYTRANQLDQLKLLNVGAYLTTADPNRSALERELIEGWYGGAGMPGGFDGTFVPDGWNPANNGNPANSATLYKDVFQRNCRMCHTMHVPALGPPPVNVGPTGAQGNNTPSCSQTPPAGALGIPDQYPMGCYWQFAKSTNIGKVLSEGRMPFARRTLDRLWVDPAGNPNGGTVSAAGSELITQLTDLYHSEGSTDTVIAPGTPNVTIAPLQQIGGGTPDVFSFVGLGVETNGAAGDASFVTQPSWQVCVDTGAGNCTNATQHVPVVGMNSIPATFQVPGLTGTFLAELDSAGAPLVTQTLSVASVPLAIAAILPPTPPTVSRQGSFTLDASQLISGGNGPKQWWVSGLVSLAVSGTNCTAAAKCSLDTTPSTMLMETDPTATTAGYTLNASDAVGKNQSASSPVINVTSGLNASTVSGYVIENAPAPANLVQASPGTNLDLAAGNTVGAGQTIIVQISCDGGASWVSTCSPISGTATVSNTNVAFTPPFGFATNPPNGASTGLNGQTLTPLQLEYRLLLYGPGNTLLDQSAAGTLNVQVRARVAFATDVVGNVFQRPNSNPYPSGLSQCASSGCHSNTPGLISFATSAQTIYCSLVGCPTPLTPTTDATRKFVDSTDATNSAPPQSVVLRHPAELDAPNSHLGGQRCAGGFSGSSPMTAGAPCDLTPILQWIEDGANDF